MTIPTVELIMKMLASMTKALSTASLYSSEHPQVQKHMETFSVSFDMYCQQTTELLLAHVEDELVYQGKPLQKSIVVERLLRYFKEQNFGYLKLSRGVTAEELKQMVKVLLGKEDLHSLSLVSNHIVIGAVDSLNQSGNRPIASFEELTDEEKKGINNQFEAVADQKTLEIEQLSSIIAGFIEAFRNNANPLLALVPIRMQDEYTFTHSIDVGILNIAQGMALGIEGQMLRDLGIAGMLHDVGKIFVDREILNKKGKLDDDEFEKIKEHPSRGAQYLMAQDGVPRLALLSAYEHHMRNDLTGYPKTKPDWKLSIASQMTMISDTFDALRTHRSYKTAWDFSKASGLLLNLSGTQLHPGLTLNFLKVLAQMGEDIESFADDEESEEMKDLFTGCSCSLENPRCG